MQSATVFFGSQTFGACMAGWLPQGSACGKQSKWSSVAEEPNNHKTLLRERKQPIMSVA